LHLPCASTLYSLAGLPGVLSTRRVHGVKALQSLTWQRSSRSLDATSPLAISDLAAFSRHIAYCVDASPRLVVPPGSTHRPGQLRPVPLGSMAIAALSALEAWLHSAASLQGLDPSAGWGHRSPISQLPRHPGSLGLGLPGAFPFPALGLDDCPCCLSAYTEQPRGPPRSLTAPGHGIRRRLSSRALQERSRTGYCSLCFRVSKSRVVGLPLPRLPAP